VLHGDVSHRTRAVRSRLRQAHTRTERQQRGIRCERAGTRAHRVYIRPPALLMMNSVRHPVGIPSFYRITF